MLAVFAMAAIALRADNTLGTWKLNIVKSKQAPRASPNANLTVMREATDDGVRMTTKGERADGSKIDYTYTLRLDGKAVAVVGTGIPWDTVSLRQSTANSATEERSKAGGKYHATNRLVVTKDGRTMTATQKGTGADGKAFTQMLAFDKQ